MVVVPQVGFRKGDLAAGKYRWWTPYLDQDSLPSFMKVFNEALRGVAQRMKVSYVDSVDSFVWSDDLFVDVSHLNGNGNERMATLIAPEVRKVTLLTGD